MTKWKGKIVQKANRDWHTATLYSFKIEGESKWFKTGTVDIPFDEGVVVSFEERNGKVDLKTVVEETGAAPSESAPKSPTQTVVTAVNGPNDSRENYWQKREERDIAQENSRKIAAARADACTIVAAALAADHLPHAANTQKGKRLDLLLGYVREITNTFLEEENS